MVLDPIEALKPRSSEHKLKKEMLASLDRKWTVHIIHGRPVKYTGLPFKYEVHCALFGSFPKSAIFKLLFLASSIITGVRIVRKYGVHLLLSKSGHLHLGLVALLIARLTNRKCLVRVADDAMLALRIFLKRAGFPDVLINALTAIAKCIEVFVLRRADWVVTHGPQDYEKIKRLTRRVSFVPLGVDATVFRPLVENVQELKESIIENAEKKVILFVGRLNPVKDLPTLFKAFKMLSRERDDLALLVIGSGVEETRYREMVEQMGIADKVFFLGFVPHDNLPVYYNIADVYVLPSLWEEWSNTIMEAMACGVPVVATNVGANPYLIKDGETGFLVPPREPRALAEKIAFVLDNPELVKEIARKARAEIVKYSITSMSSAYKKI
ncbi:MAG: hypothetical protein DRN00_01540, partial [Thermoplasmata archaeon]